MGPRSPVGLGMAVACAGALACALHELTLGVFLGDPLHQ